jgi:glycosyltransferase involved in cell wall biosynthesis
MNKEVIRHGENGFLAEDDTDWLTCIDELLNQGEFARRIAAAGRRTVEEEYSIPIVSRRMIAALDRVLEQRRRRRSNTGSPP